MKIRAALLADADPIAALWNEMINTSLATFTTQEKSTQDVEALIAKRKDAFWVADEGGVQGFITYGPFRDGPGYSATVEHTIILTKKKQGQGTGRILMQRAETVAKVQGHHVMVAAISCANPDAVTFHSRLGFEKIGQLRQVGRKHAQWLDLILMQKVLSTP